MLTLFSLPKAFKNHIGIIQRNAIKSWTLLRPRPEIILLGDDEGTKEAAQEFMIRHIPQIKRNGYGTPLVNDIFYKAQAAAGHRILCYVNPDIILMSDFIKTISRIVHKRTDFLLVGQRWDLDITRVLNYEDRDWEKSLQTELRMHGLLHLPTGSDYFVFPKRLFGEIPPFAVGRTKYDNWLIWQARSLSVPVIDATRVITPVHQNHERSYSSLGIEPPEGVDYVREGIEAKRNLELAGGEKHIFTIRDATSRLAPRLIYRLNTVRARYRSMAVNPIFLLLMEDYHKIYKKTIEANPQMLDLPYSQCAKQLFSEFFYYGDSYSYILASKGLKAEQVIPMCESLQYKWASEHGTWLPPAWIKKHPFRWYWRRTFKVSIEHSNLLRILTEQIKKLRPRFLWVFSGIPLSRDILRRWRPYTERMILWWSSSLSPEFSYRSFDLILSAIPLLVRHFQNQGLNARYLPHSFDSRILKYVIPASKRIPKVVFVGSLTEDHKERILFLDFLSRHIEIDFYGQGVGLLPEDSPLRKSYKGHAWGKRFYSIYGTYLVVIHKNIDLAAKEASAKRLFEATGMGACLITEMDQNLKDLFNPEREVVTYSNPEECIEKIKYLLANPQEALQIGKRGQDRTLAEHTYEHRVAQLMRHIIDSGFDLSKFIPSDYKTNPPSLLRPTVPF